MHEDLLEELDPVRVAEMPRQANAAAPDPGLATRSAVLTSAFHAGDPVFLGWRRPSAEAPIEVHVAGPALRGSATDDGGMVLSLPRGARARPASPLDELYGALPHAHAVTAVFEGLIGGERDGAAPSLEDCLLDVWHEPFTWFVHATPLSSTVLADEIASLVAAQRRALGKATTSPDLAVEAVRLERRVQEFKQAQATGMWEVRLVAGGMTASAATRVAGFLCVSTDLSGLPYVLMPAPATPSFLCPTGLLARLVRPPEREIPGIRFRLRHSFDVTQEPRDGPGLPLGRILDQGGLPVGELELPPPSLNRHTFVCGSTGAGKSQTIRALLEAATTAGLPWLVVEPVKSEYRLMANRVDADLLVIRPGDPLLPPASLNPLEPAATPNGRRFPLQAHLDLTRALFLAVFQADEPLPQVMAAALTRCYTELGWDLVLSEARGPGPRYPTLADLERTAEQVITDIGYGREVTDNVRGFVRVRLASLRLGTTGRFFEAGHPLDMERLLRGNVVIELEDVGDDQDKAFLMGTLLIRLVEQLRLAGPSAELRHVTVIEEAHRLLRRVEERPAAHAVETFARLLAEIRAFGEGLVIAEQIPERLQHDVIKNTAVKVVHRLPALDDRTVVGATMNMTAEQSEYLVTLEPGRAAVFTDGMDYPILVRMPDGTARESARAPTVSAPAPLVDPRSAGCPPTCRERLCDLRDMRSAEHLLADDPRIGFWAELAVIAHLTGWPSPVPAAPLRDTLRTLPVRLLDCALSQAADAAIAARSTAIASRVPVADLAAHVATALRARVAGSRACDREEPRWLAPPFRWALVWAVLRRAGDSGAPHPRTAEWSRRYGRPLPDAPVAEQLAVVARWYDAERTKDAATAVIFGAHQGVPPIHAYLGATPDSTEFPAHLKEALSAFDRCAWPIPYLSGRTGP